MNGLELTGPIEERFEWRELPDGIEITGTGRLLSLSVTFPGWLTPRVSEEAVGIDLEHEAGVSARVRFRSGQRLRLEVTVESDTDDLLAVPGPVLRVGGPARWSPGSRALPARSCCPVPMGPGC
ncbi:hypothetical protein [Tessaracoccus coleopterorum]|uniref:hypothetical protein n=1 Tax=Tessaracoccus coleopterorum TaxID=2714950 RepID=UPI001E2B83EA|nr:hypothetical protein [Tessaracoccus coleopterorum]